MATVDVMLQSMWFRSCLLPCWFSAGIPPRAFFAGAALANSRCMSQQSLLNSHIRGTSLGRHSLVSHFMCGTRWLRPFCPSHVPSWDFCSIVDFCIVVLEGLTGLRFELLVSASERILMLKMVLILALKKKADYVAVVLSSALWLTGERAISWTLCCEGVVRIFHWDNDVISLAYEARGLSSPLSIWAHSTRGVASSQALSKGGLLEELCVATGWASPFFLVNACSGADILAVTW